MWQISFTLFIVLIATASARPKWHQLKDYTFEKYIHDFNKMYSTAEEKNMRERRFYEKLREIRSFNNHGNSYYKGVNHLTDRTVEELQQMRGAIPNHPPQSATTPKIHVQSSAGLLPHSVDYTKTVPPILTAIKDQGQCGSCWAHAATEEIESHLAIATGKLFVLSQQQLVSCVDNSQQCGGTGGCNGATAELAFQYASKTGITQEWMYGYQSYFGVTPKCAFNSSQTIPIVRLNGFVLSKRNDPIAVQDALAFAGPLAISVDASSWSDYESGIFKGCDYAKNITMDHAVQLVGYGSDQTLGLDYWLVRNSWSPAWGENGYIRLYREKGTPQCGWNNDWDTQGGGCKGDPNTVWACGECGILYDTLYPNIIKP